MEVPQSDAETLFQTILNMFENNNIPLEHIIGYASDTTDVMFGEFNSVVSQLKE